MLSAAVLPIWAQILLGEPMRRDTRIRNYREVPQEAVSKHCLVLLAHGSKDPRWREPFESLFLKVRRDGERVKLAYMEFIGPTLFEVADECVREHVKHIQILPLFMAAGAHLATDVPEQVTMLRERYPQLHIETLPPIGEDPRMMSLMRHMIMEKLDRV